MSTRFERLLATLSALEPLALFVAVYAAGMWLVARFAPPSSIVSFHLSALGAACAATLIVLLRSPEARSSWRMQWRLRDALRGGVLAFCVITVSGGVVLLSGEASHEWHGGFPLVLVITLIAPAAIHEELVFRGVAFEALLVSGRGVAIAVSSIVFALLHASNPHISPIALLNILLGGWLLAEVRLRWGLASAMLAHFVWNVTSGPVLGYPVSGLRLAESLLVASPDEPHWWSGGMFGLEGGLAMSIVLFSFVIAMERARSQRLSRYHAALSRGDDSTPHHSQET